MMFWTIFWLLVASGFYHFGRAMFQMDLSAAIYMVYAGASWIAALFMLVARALVLA